MVLLGVSFMAAPSPWTATTVVMDMPDTVLIWASLLQAYLELWGWLLWRDCFPCAGADMLGLRMHLLTEDLLDLAASNRASDATSQSPLALASGN